MQNNGQTQQNQVTTRDVLNNIKNAIGDISQTLYSIHSVVGQTFGVLERDIEGLYKKLEESQAEKAESTDKKGGKK